jgi:hypothetical protein
MSDYNRTTRECPVSQLHPEIRQAIRNYFKEHELGDTETGILICCETVSERKSAGAFLKDNTADTTIHTGMVLTPELLIWVRKGDKSGLIFNYADLREIKVRVHASLFDREAGMDVHGFIGNAKARVKGYIGMGEEPAAKKFLEEVEKAISAANPPSKSIWSRWLGGG